jgi:transposase
VPRQYSTGGRSILGRISKRGSRYLRMLLVQAARVLLMRPHTWSRFSFGAWLRTASERLHRHKLAIALANKLARIGWSVLRHEKGLRHTPRDRGDLALSTEFAMEKLHGTD